MVGAAANPVVVKTAAYGDLKDSDLSLLMYQHRVALGFLAQLKTESLRRLYPGQQIDMKWSPCNWASTSASKPKRPWSITGF